MRRYVLSTLLGLLFLSAEAHASSCRIDLQPVASWKEGKVSFAILEGEMTGENETGYSPWPALARFRQEARQTISDVSPLALLRRQMRIFASANYDVRVFENVISGASRWIKPMSCIEGYFMERHARTIGSALFGHYSEFGVYALREGNSARRRIYFQSNPETAMLPTSDHVRRLIRRDRSQGYHLEFHLHNHPFSPQNPHGDIAGTTIPSGGPPMNAGDFSAFEIMSRDMGLHEARITNGFHTLRIRTSELGQLLRPASRQ